LYIQTIEKRGIRFEETEKGASITILKTSD
jgi:hypothetical protein